MSGAGRRATILAGVLAAMLFAPVASWATLSWSGPTPLDRAAQLEITTAACPSSTVCVAFDTAGRETTFDPQSPGSRVSSRVFDGTYGRELDGSSWPQVTCLSASTCLVAAADGQETIFDPADPDALTRYPIDSAGLLSVACPTTTQCTGLDSSGDEVTFNPTAPGVPARFYIDRGTDPEAVACASSTSCVIFDASGSLWAFNPQQPTSDYQSITPAGAITGLTCPSIGLCLYASGEDVVTFAPDDAASTTSTQIDSNPLTRLVCPSASQCTAVDDTGAQVTFNPTSPGSPSAITVDHIAQPSALACATATQCTEFDSSGDTVTFDPQATAPAPIDGNLIQAFACPSSTQCTAIDDTHSGGYPGTDTYHELTFDPSAPGTPNPVTIYQDSTGDEIAGLACPTITQCTQIDPAPGAPVASGPHQVTFDPQNAQAPTPVSIPFEPSLTGSLACPSSDQCTVVSATQEDTFDPSASSTPSPVTIDGSGSLGALTCPSRSQCTALDGSSAVTFDPNAPSGLTRVGLPTFNPVGLSCPTTTQCTTWAGGQEVTFDPTSVAIPQSPITIDPSLGTGTMEMVCPSISECVVDDSHSGVLTFDPAHPLPSLPVVIDGEPNLSLSCLSAQLCVGVDPQQGVVTFDPAAPPEAPVQLQPGPGLTSVACAAASFCTAVDDDGYEVTFNPATPSGSQPVAIDGDSFLTGVACTGESVCAAVDNAGQEVTFDPSSPTEPTAPTRTEIDYRNGVNIELTGVACATPSLCAATDADGDLLTFAPAAASSAVNHVIDPGYALAGVACPSAGQCTAVDDDGRALTFDPASPATPNPVAIDPGQALTAISCSSVSSCVATDADGGLVSFNPTSTASLTRTAVDPGHDLLAVSCPTSGFCLAVDDAGREVDGNPSQPATFTLDPTGDGAALESVDCTAAAQCVVGDLSGDLLVGSPAQVRVGPSTGAPTISGARLTFSRSGRAALHFAVHAGTGAPPLSSLAIALPHGLSYGSLTHDCHKRGRVKRCSAAIKGLTVSDATVAGAKLAHGTLTITLARTAREISVTATNPLLRTLASLAAAISRRKGSQRTITLVLSVRVTDSSHHTTRLTTLFKRKVHT